MASQQSSGWAKAIIPSVITCVVLLAGASRWSGSVGTKVDAVAQRIDLHCSDSMVREAALKLADDSLAKAIKEGDASLARQLKESQDHLLAEIKRVYENGCLPSLRARERLEGTDVKLEQFGKQIDRMETKQDQIVELLLELKRNGNGG